MKKWRFSPFFCRILFLLRFFLCVFFFFNTTVFRRCRCYDSVNVTDTRTYRVPGLNIRRLPYNNYVIYLRTRMRNINKTRRCRRTQTLCGRQNNDIIRLNYNDGGVFFPSSFFSLSSPPPSLWPVSFWNLCNLYGRKSK